MLQYLFQYAVLLNMQIIVACEFILQLTCTAGSASCRISNMIKFTIIELKYSFGRAGDAKYKGTSFLEIYDAISLEQREFCLLCKIKLGRDLIEVDWLLPNEHTPSLMICEFSGEMVVMHHEKWERNTVKCCKIVPA